MLKAKLFIAFFSLLFSSAAFALEWRSMIPAPGGRVEGMAISALNPNNIMAGGDVFGAAVSHDGGTTFEPSFGFQMEEFESFTWHPTEAGTVFAATLGGIYKSTDAGNNFTILRNGLPPMITLPSRGYSAPISSIAADTAHPGTFYAASGTIVRSGDDNIKRVGDIYKTENNGDSWTKVFNGVAGRNCSNNIVHIVVDPFNSSTLFKSMFCDGVWKSVDAGITWQKKSNGLSSMNAGIIVADSTRQGTFFVSAGGRVFKTTNSGDTWIDKSAPISGVSLAICASNPNILYGGGYTWGNGLWKSTDNGESWTQIFHSSIPDPDCVNVNPTPNYPMIKPYTMDIGLGIKDHSLQVDPTNCNKVVFGTGEGMYRSLDGGQSWIGIGGTTSDGGATWTGSGFGGSCIYSIEFDVRNENHIFVGGADGTFWQTWNGGQTWEMPHNGINGNCVCIFHRFTDIAISHTSSNNIFTINGKDGGLFHTTDGAAHWTPMQTGFYSIEFVKSDSGNDSVLCAARSGNIVRSTNSGQSFSSTTGGAIGDTKIMISTDPTNYNTLYAATESHGVFKSTDGCMSWANIGLVDEIFYADTQGGMVSKIAVDPTNPARLFAQARYNTWKYENGVWSKVVPDTYYGTDIEVLDDGTVYRTESINPGYDQYRPTTGIWKSADHGATWERAATINNIRVLGFRIIKRHPANSSILLAGAACGGIFKLEGLSPIPPPACTMAQLMAYISQWKAGTINMVALMNKISKWKAGQPC